MSEIKRVRVVKPPKTLDEDMQVNFDPEPISYEDLDTRLRKARQKAAGVHAILTAVHMDLESWHEGEPLTIVMRELEVLEHLLDDTVLRYAESVADQIKRQLA